MRWRSVPFEDVYGNSLERKLEKDKDVVREQMMNVAPGWQAQTIGGAQAFSVNIGKPTATYQSATLAAGANQ